MNKRSDIIKDYNNSIVLPMSLKKLDDKNFSIETKKGNFLEFDNEEVARYINKHKLCKGLKLTFKILNQTDKKIMVFPLHIEIPKEKSIGL